MIRSCLAESESLAIRYQPVAPCSLPSLLIKMDLSLAPLFLRIIPLLTALSTLLMAVMVL